MDIICAGEMLIDFTPMQQPGAYMANPGGSPANVAIATVFWAMMILERSCREYWKKIM